MADHQPTIIEEEEEDEGVVETSVSQDAEQQVNGEAAAAVERETTDVTETDENGDKVTPPESDIAAENGEQSAHEPTQDTIGEESEPTEQSEAEKTSDEIALDSDEPAQETDVEKGDDQKTDEEADAEKADDEKADDAQEGEETVGEPGGEAGEKAEGEEVEGEVAKGEEDVARVMARVEEEDEPQEPEASERGESPVGERLSREGSPELDEDVRLDRLEPSSPRAPVGSEMGESERSEFDDDEPEFTREQLLEQYHVAVNHKETLQHANYQMQHRLADYFRKKKSEDSRQELEKNVTDQEQRYLKYMANLEELRKQDLIVKESYEYEIQQNRELCEDKLNTVDADRGQFVEYKNHVATHSVNSRSGKPIPPRDIEQFLQSEMKKELEVINVRLENIKLKNRLKKREQQLKSKEELAEGLHLIDFEQLKIENQTYNEKIEERNEELLKLRKKITSTVQVLTHLKEKLQFVQGENLVSSDSLKEVEQLAAQKRDVLSRTKQARDALRIENQKLRENAGLLGNEPLLRDYEDRKDDVEACIVKLDNLKMQHAENTLSCNQVRRKIEQVRLQQS